MKTSSQPVSVRLDTELKRKATAYARRRKVGLTTALRMIISEHLEHEQADADLNVILRWQHDQAWKTYERWKRGDSKEHTLDDVREAHRKAMTRKLRR